MTTNECQCGCGAPVVRRFRPGHDARLKSRLLAQTRTNLWWVRESAVHQMVELNWGHFVDVETLANTPVRTRRNGQFVQSCHVENLAGTHVDNTETAHSHRFCPDVQGQTEFVKGVAGWTCSTCVHTEDLVTQVWKNRQRQWVVMG